MIPSKASSVRPRSFPGPDSQHESTGRRSIAATIPAISDAPEFVEPASEDRGLDKTGEIPEETQLVGIEVIP